MSPGLRRGRQPSPESGQKEVCGSQTAGKTSPGAKPKGNSAVRHRLRVQIPVWFDAIEGEGDDVPAVVEANSEGFDNERSSIVVDVAISFATDVGAFPPSFVATLLSSTVPLAVALALAVRLNGASLATSFGEVSFPLAELEVPLPIAQNVLSSQSESHRREDAST